jgi:pimeloyl-ACP methyl ester carboxylesterase
VPALLLVGSDSPEIFKKSAEIVHAALPSSRVHELPGQQHLADLMAPEMVANALIGFLIEEATPAD